MDAKEVTARNKNAEDNIFSTRNQRMDKDFDIWSLKEIIYEKYKTSINVTSNDPRTFSDNVHTDLAFAEMQIIIRMAEAEGENEDVGKLERLFYFLLEKADENLLAKLLPPLREYLIWCSLVRGCPAARILIYKDGDKVIPDFLPYDARWLTYEVGSNGLAWTSYKMFLTRSQLENEWEFRPSGTSVFTPWVKDKNTYPALDNWEVDKDKIYNSVTCEGAYLKEPELYDVKSIPVLIMPIPVSPPIVSTSGDDVGGFGESIFANKRGAYELQNRLASMWATHANILKSQPLLNYITEESQRLNSTILYAEGVYNLPMNKQKIEASPLKEVSPTLLSLVNWNDAQIESASLPHLGLGTPPPSGTALNLVREAGNRIYNPQVRNLNRFYAAMCRLIEEQLINSKIKVDVESERERKYIGEKVTPIDLKKPHIIKVEFTVKTAWSQLDVAQQADMLKRLGLPDKWIWEFILKLPDPRLIEDLAAIEMAEHSPILAMKKAVEALIKYGRTDDAEALVRQMDRMESQERMESGEIPPQGIEPEEGMPSEEMGGGI